jgi:hypothetical protein
MAFFTASRDLVRHQEACERAAEEGRREAREDAKENRRALERLEDRMTDAIKQLGEKLDAKLEALHGVNQRDIRALWITMRIGTGAAIGFIVMFLAFLVEHGGLRGLIKGL